MTTVSKPTEVNEVTVHVHAASPIGDQPQPYLMLIAAKSIDVQHEYPLSTLADVYATEGITIASALCRTLPQGTTHQVLIALLQRQVTLLMPAAGWPSNAGAEMRTCAVCSKPVEDCICGDEEPPVPVREISLGDGAVAFVRETSDEAMLRDQRQAQARSDAEETTAAFRAPAPDPRGGPFPPSPWGSRENVGISPAKLFEKAFMAGCQVPAGSSETMVASMLAAALKGEGLS